METMTKPNCDEQKDLVDIINAEIEATLEQIAELERDEPRIRTDTLWRHVRELRQRREAAYLGWRRCLAGIPLPRVALTQLVGVATVMTDNDSFAGPLTVPVTIRFQIGIEPPGVSMDGFQIGGLPYGSTATFSSGSGSFDKSSGKLDVHTSVTVSTPVGSPNASLVLSTDPAAPIPTKSGGTFSPSGMRLTPDDPTSSGQIALAAAFSLNGSPLDGAAVSLQIAGTMSPR